MVPIIVPIPSCPGYGASKDGRIWSRLKGDEWRPRHDMPDKDGYRVIILSLDRTRRNRKVHRLVVEAFHGPIPDGMTINHLDGNKANNNLGNLEVATRGENLRHASESGLLSHETGRHNAGKTHCRNGHAYDSRNTYTYTSPNTGRAQRMCRTCGRNRAAKRRAHKEAE